MTFIVWWVLLAVVTGIIATGKGRGFLVWMFYGALLPIVALPWAILLKPDRKVLEQKAIASHDARKCPHCAELIKPEAKVCRFCGRDVEPVTRQVEVWDGPL